MASRRRNKKMLPNSTLSLLDMLFSTFGGIILLSILFSSIIVDKAAIEANQFYHAMMNIRANIPKGNCGKGANEDNLIISFDVGSYDPNRWVPDKEPIYPEPSNKLPVSALLNDNALSVYANSHCNSTNNGIEYNANIDIAYFYERSAQGPNPKERYSVSYRGEPSFCSDLTADPAKTITITLIEQFGDQHEKMITRQLSCSEASDMARNSKNFFHPKTCIAAGGNHNETCGRVMYR